MRLLSTRMLAMPLAAALCSACVPLERAASPVTAGASSAQPKPAASAPAARDDLAALLASLLGSQWLLEDITQRGVIDRLQSTLGFPQAGQLAGSGGCNRFMGPARLDQGRLTIGPLVSTRMACSPAAMNQEQRYLGLLGQATGIRLEEPWLLIDTPEGALKFSRQR
jgi:heat shock protein HslJ